MEDTGEIYFMRADRDFERYRILASACIESGWQTPTEVPFAAGPGINDADPFLASDGRQFFFISTRHRYAEVGNDDFDIYVMRRNPDGAWGEPERLPEPVNSPGSELLPRIDR